MFNKKIKTFRIIPISPCGESSSGPLYIPEWSTEKVVRGRPGSVWGREIEGAPINNNTTHTHTVLQLSHSEQTTKKTETRARQKKTCLSTLSAQSSYIIHSTVEKMCLGHVIQLSFYLQYVLGEQKLICNQAFTGKQNYLRHSDIHYPKNPFLWNEVERVKVTVMRNGLYLQQV